jgi:hypothetical protein
MHKAGFTKPAGISFAGDAVSLLASAQRQLAG